MRIQQTKGVVTIYSGFCDFDDVQLDGEEPVVLMENVL